MIFTRPMTIYNSSEPINWAAFSKAKPLRSPRLVYNWIHTHCSEEVDSICILVQCQNFYSLIPLLDDFQWLPVSRENFYPAFFIDAFIDHIW